MYIVVVNTWGGVIFRGRVSLVFTTTMHLNIRENIRKQLVNYEHARCTVILNIARPYSRPNIIDIVGKTFVASIKLYLQQRHIEMGQVTRYSVLQLEPNIHR